MEHSASATPRDLSPSAAAHETVVIDFKTDQPASGDVREAYPEYVAQLSTYAEIVGAQRSGLLFSATGP